MDLRPIDVDICLEVFLVLRDVLLRKLCINVKLGELGGLVEASSCVPVDRVSLLYATFDAL